MYSTVEIARLVGIDKTTLLRWLYAGTITEPRHRQFAGQDVRVWSKRDLQRVKKYKAENYRKGRGRKSG